MNDESPVVPAMIAGAALGALAGYLFFTEPGRRLRRQLEPALEQFAREVSGFRSSMQRAIGVASQGWGLPDESARAPHVH
jgi:hypothetical protein